MQYAGEEYLNHPAQINIWRAPTDNDMYRKEEWKRAHYHEAYMRAYETRVCTAKHTVVVSGRAAITAASIQRIMDVEIRWEINAAGKIFCEITAVKDREFPELPRFGIRLFLDKRMDEVRYYGMGPQESYRDKHRASCHGLYHSKVCRMHEDYIRPQENGSHYDCDFVELASSQYAVTAASDTPFSFQVSHYTQEELERASHNYELTESDSTVLCLDYALNGIGSNSCGPDLLEKYRLDETEIHFSFALVPFERDEKESAGFL